MRSTRWIQEWRTDGLLDFRLGRDRDELVAEWGGLGELRSSRSAEDYHFTPHPDATERVIAKWLRGPVQALLRHLRGEMSLHASAASRGGAAALFLGESTCGKSTLVAQLCAREGFAMIADDVTFLEQGPDGFYVLPSESTHWLRQDAAALLGGPALEGDKAPLAPVAVAQAPVKVQSMAYLAFDESSPSAKLEWAPGPDAFRWLRTSLFRFVIDEPEVDLSDFEKLAALHHSVPLRELTRRRALSNLAECVDLLLGTWPGWKQTTPEAARDP